MARKTVKPNTVNKPKVDYERLRILPIFKAFLPIGKKKLPWKHFCNLFKKFGYRIHSDPFFEPILNAWEQENRPDQLDLALFTKLIHPCYSNIEKAIQGQIIIPDFSHFTDTLKEIFEETNDVRQGKVADYIPQLARVPADKFGVGICTIDAQRHHFGDADDFFCVQSTCKPITYCLALEACGETRVHQHVGREPSGHSFNELSLNPEGLPHNPMINSGAIMTTAMIKPDLSPADRFDYVMSQWNRLTAYKKPGFSNTVFLSEKETADRNFALGYFMRENKAFPEGTDLLSTLSFYFQTCSIEVSCNMMSVVAATLANGGICPITNEIIFQPETVQHCLSLMYSCGMYDFSGEWAFSVGLPAKSGVSGAIMVVIPNVMGLCSWSPRLDTNGNSVRGIAFYKALLEKYNFHNFDNLLQNTQHKKQDPRRVPLEEKSDQRINLLWACSTNEISEIRRLIAQGIDLSEPDYDGRTALHLACAEGHIEVVKLLVSNGVELHPKDRWGHTPLDDAKQSGNKNIAELLESVSKKKKR